MQAGVEYTASFYLYMPGNLDYGHASDFSFTVGDEQDSEFHTPLLTLPRYTNEAWTKHTVKYTPYRARSERSQTVLGYRSGESGGG